MITLGITRLLTEHQEWIEGKSARFANKSHGC